MTLDRNRALVFVALCKPIACSNLKTIGDYSPVQRSALPSAARFSTANPKSAQVYSSCRCQHSRLIACLQDQYVDARRDIPSSATYNVRNTEEKIGCALCLT